MDAIENDIVQDRSHHGERYSLVLQDNEERQHSAILTPSPDQILSVTLKPSLLETIDLNPSRDNGIMTLHEIHNVSKLSC
jgi:hypothetical protein